MVCVATPRALADRLRPSAEEPVSFKFRSAPQAGASWTPATFADGRGRFGLTSLELLDGGDGRVGARSPARVEPGMTLNFHRPGSRFPTASALVVGCDAGEGGFLLALSLRPDTAA